MSDLKRIIAHWSVTGYKADAISRQHYHFIYEGDGKEVAGIHAPEANIAPKKGKYAAHTLNCNKGSIGVACAAMLGAKSVTAYGDYPIRPAQFDAMCKGIARLCKKYQIPVRPDTVLSHAEVQGTLEIKQRGKWDISVLPFLGLTTAGTCGDEMRRRVAAYMKAGTGQALPSKPPVAPASPKISPPVSVPPSKPVVQAPKSAPVKPEPIPAKERGLVAAILSAIGLGGASGAAGFDWRLAVPVVILAALIIGVIVYLNRKGK